MAWARMRQFSRLAAFSTSTRLAPEQYKPPEFASSISSRAPTHRIPLAITPTPLHAWPLVGLPEKVRVDIKRDDMTGSTAGGNKVRKLEFLLADAVRRGHDTVITGGAVQSNFARSTAVLCKQLGLDCHVLLRSADENAQNLGVDGNVLLHRMVGTRIHLTRRGAGLRTKMDALAKRLREGQGANPYVIDIGGSDAIGLWGYISAFAEIIDQQGLHQYTDCVLPVGSGGTAAGVAIANHLAGGTMRVHAVAVCDSPDDFYAHINEMLGELGLSDVEARDIIDIWDGKGLGYGCSTKEELRFLVDVAHQTGIVLDRVYSGKAAKWFMDELQKQSGAFSQRPDVKLLFWFTGGLFGMFDREIESVLGNSLVSKFEE